jgi:hypothetical protein
MPIKRFASNLSMTAPCCLALGTTDDYLLAYLHELEGSSLVRAREGWESTSVFVGGPLPRKRFMAGALPSERP